MQVVWVTDTGLANDLNPASAIWAPASNSRCEALKDSSDSPWLRANRNRSASLSDSTSSLSSTLRANQRLKPPATQSGLAAVRSPNRELILPSSLRRQCRAPAERCLHRKHGD